MGWGPKLVREHIETAQLVLVGMSSELEELRLRCMQAMRRTCAADDLLEPAVERLEQMQAEVDLMRAELKSAWSVGDAAGWKIKQK